MTGKGAELGLDRISHVVEIMPDGSGIHVVEDGSCSPGSSVDDACERLELDHGIELPLAFRNVNGDDAVLDVSAEVDCIVQASHGIRGQAD